MNADDLLTPSLGAAPRARLFSVNALIAAAFFGGAFAVLLIAFENARRLGRLRRDGAALALATLAAALALLVAFATLGPDPAEARGEVRLLSRGLGFACAGGCYWLHRQPYRGQKLLGIDPASPWIPVIGAVLASVLASILLYLVASGGLAEGIRWP